MNYFPNNPFILIVAMLSVIMLNVIMLKVAMLSVLAPAPNLACKFYTRVQVAEGNIDTRFQQTRACIHKTWHEGYCLCYFRPLAP
jgi:hypothetical protein